MGHKYQVGGYERAGRAGGGVALYGKESIESTIVKYGTV